MMTFYDIDTVCDMIGDDYLIVKRQDAQRKQVRRVVHDGLLDDSRQIRHADSEGSLREKVEHVIGGNANSIVSAMQRSKIDAYYKAVLAN